MKNLFETKNYAAIREALSNNPKLANEGISLGMFCLTKAHPLHRICDSVFAEKITDEEGVEIAKIFLEFGANVNGNEMVEKHDTPLIAAASLNADNVGILYIENGSNIRHAGTHGGTGLHWAAWCGRPKLVEKLIQVGAEINRICIDHQATPLFWTIHGLKNSDGKSRADYTECVRLLVAAGADKTIPNGEGTTVFDLLSDGDGEFKDLLEA